MRTLDESLGFFLRRAYYTLRQRAAGELQPLGLTPEQYSVIFVLGQTRELPQRELTRRLFSDSNTLSAVLRRLEEKGWVERIPDPDDRRGKLVRITARGKRLRERAVRATTALTEAAYEGFPEVDRARLKDLLERVYENLAEDDEAAGA